MPAVDKKAIIPTKHKLRKFGVPLALIPGIMVASMLGFDYEKLLKTSPRSNPDIYGTEIRLVEVEYVQIQNDSYGRLRGYLFVRCDYDNQKYCKDGRLNVNVVLAGKEMAVVKLGKTYGRLKPDYSKELRAAEKERS